MSAIKYADGLRERGVSFTLFRNALRQRDLEASTGWDNTIDKIVEFLNNPKTENAYSQGLEDIYQDITLYGTKLIKIYKIGDAASQILSTLNNGLIQEETIYDALFPLPLERAELLKAPLALQCVTKYEDETSSDFIFCSKQFVYERLELTNEALLPEALDEYGEFDEIYGVTKYPIQLFDIVSVNLKDGLIEFRMDGAGRQKLADIEKRLRVLTSKIKKFIVDQLGTDHNLGDPINFFPCIEKLYKEADGRVLDIGHSTETAGVHRGKVRGKKVDVRKDNYHAEGVKGISALNAHMLQKGWDSLTRIGVVELAIPGTLSLTSSLNPAIKIAYVLGCALEDDYRFLLSKISE